MSEKYAKRIHIIYGIVFSLVLLTAGICLIFQCVGIYMSGDKPFSRAAVAAAFEPIRIPVYLCLAMIVGSFLLRLIFPVSSEKLHPQRQTRMILLRLCEKADLDMAEASVKQAILAQRGQRKRLGYVTVLCSVVCAVTFLCYALNPNNYHTSDITTSMVKAMWVLIPCAAIPFAVALLRSYLCLASMDKEIALLKQLPKISRPKAETPSGKDRTELVRMLILVIAAAAFTFGLLNGGAMDVLTKAVNICTECVGLG